MGNLRSLQLRMEIDKHSCQSIKHASQIALSSYGTCCRFCIPQLSTLYWCQTIQKAPWALRWDSGWFQRRFCAVGPLLYSTVVLCMEHVELPKNGFLLVSDALAGRALEFSPVSRVWSWRWMAGLWWNVGKAQPSLRVTLAFFKSQGYCRPWNSKGLGRQKHARFASEEDALRQHYPSEFVCDGLFLEHLDGLLNTHTDRAFCRTCVAKLICHTFRNVKTCGFTPAKSHEPFTFFHQVLSVRNWKTQGAVFTGCWNSQSRHFTRCYPAWRTKITKKPCWQGWNAEFLGVFKPLMRFANASASATVIFCKPE